MKFNFKAPKFIIILSLVILGGALAYAANEVINKNKNLPPQENAYVPGGEDFVPETENNEIVIKDYVLLNVPFTSQAPNANWSDPRQQDGCEEASVLMAWMWINNHTISKNNAEQAIIDISKFQELHYGNYIDTDARDTARFMREYFDYDKVDVVMNPSLDDIKRTLSAGRLVIVPANGQKLGNPNFTAPGPYTHMVVIKGYDESKKQFITNDPGTRNGEGYVYAYQTLYNAMVDYPSGNHLPQEGRPKAMIVVEK